MHSLKKKSLYMWEFVAIEINFLFIWEFLLIFIVAPTK